MFMLFWAKLTPVRFCSVAAIVAKKNQSFVPQSFLVMWSEYSETGEQAEIDHSLSFFFQHQAIRTNIVDCN